MVNLCRISSTEVSAVLVATDNCSKWVGPMCRHDFKKPMMIMQVHFRSSCTSSSSVLLLLLKLCCFDSSFFLLLITTSFESTITAVRSIGHPLSKKSCQARRISWVSDHQVCRILMLVVSASLSRIASRRSRSAIRYKSSHFRGDRDFLFGSSFSFGALSEHCLFCNPSLAQNQNL